MIRFHGMFGLAAILAVAGCAAGAQSSESRGSGDVITAEQLATIQVSTAYEAVQQLRPQFLRQRGVTTLRGAGPEGQPTGINETGTELVVYVDKMRAGGVERLHDIGIEGVAEIRYVNARDATTMYGTGHAGGVIEVTLKR